MRKDTGGPAFPRPISSTRSDATFDGGHAGMNLRDYLAAAALPFCLREFGGNADDSTQYAEAAYQIADKMLAVRSRE